MNCCWILLLLFCCGNSNRNQNSCGCHYADVLYQIMDTDVLYQIMDADVLCQIMNADV